MQAEAVFGAIFAAWAAAAIMTGKTFDPQGWDGGWIVDRRNDPVLYWVLVGGVSLLASILIVQVAFADVGQLLVVAVVVLSVVAGVVLFPKAAWRIVVEFFMADPVAPAKVVRASVLKPNKSTKVIVRGWERPDIERILADFSTLYELPTPWF